MKRHDPLFLVLLGAVSVAALGEAPHVSKHDTVTVRADEAWEEPNQDVVHFRGNFEIHANDWSVTAREATLFGPLDDPDRVVARGDAHIQLNSSSQSTGKPVSGEADSIEYQRVTDQVTLRGNARLLKRDNTMHAPSIEYDRKTDSFRAGGKGGGVQIMFTPEDSGNKEKVQSSATPMAP